MHPASGLAAKGRPRQRELDRVRETKGGWLGQQVPPIHPLSLSPLPPRLCRGDKHRSQQQTILEKTGRTWVRCRRRQPQLRKHEEGKLARGWCSDAQEVRPWTRLDEYDWGKTMQGEGPEDNKLSARRRKKKNKRQGESSLEQQGDPPWPCPRRGPGR